MIKWTVQADDPKHLREFLRQKGISRRIVGRVQFHGGQFLVNGHRVKTSYILADGDEIEMDLPPEPPNAQLPASDTPLDILYEDDWFLIVNKPSDILSTPSIAHRGETMVSRVKGHLARIDSPYQIVHTVTRLDRFTTGVMLFAKHMLAHSVMDQYLRNNQLDKEYCALVHGWVRPNHDLIDAPIARASDSIIERRVQKDGKPAQTEYWAKRYYAYPATLLRLKLYSGRTHQIRVHLSSRGYPLIGDDLYGGVQDLIARQALHCRRLSFIHPVTQKMLEVTAPLPDDIKQMIRNLETNSGNEVIDWLSD